MNEAAKQIFAGDRHRKSKAALSGEEKLKTEQALTGDEKQKAKQASDEKQNIKKAAPVDEKQKAKQNVKQISGTEDNSLAEQVMKISSSPHVRDKETTANIMGQVIVALMPAAIFGIYNFGIRALWLYLITIISCVVFEAAYQKMIGARITVKDLSAALTGLLLAMNLPPDVPFWLPILGSFFAIIVVKQLFGGLGQNFMNPALGARCFLLISFTGIMTSFSYDAVTTATPLADLKAGSSVDVLSMFLGTIPGTIGETCALALIFGGVFLILRGIVNYRIPVFYIGSFAIFILIYCLASGRGFDLSYLLAHLSGGGLMLGAFFMATDYVTSPITPNGKIIFGVLLGFLTFLFRVFGGSAEGVSYAIIISNLLVPLIERVTVPRSFGKGAVKRES